MTRHHIARTAATIVLFAGLAGTAQAYVGPGAGIILIGSVVVLVAAIAGESLFVTVVHDRFTAREINQRVG